MTSEAPRPGRSNRYQQALLRHFAAKADAVFCRQVGEEGETVLTWGDLEADCGRFAAAYRAAGLAPGDQALIFLRHVPELYGAFFGAMLAGVTPAFMPCSSPRQDPELYWHSHQTLIERITPAAVVTDEVTLAEMRGAGLVLGDARVILIEALPAAALVATAVPEQAIALLQHSSGTTGLKKGVALSFESVVRQIESYGAAIAIGPDDVIVSWLPLYHDMGLIACLVLPAYFGVPVTHIDPFFWIGRPGVFFDRIEKDRGTLSWLPNFAFEHLCVSVGRHSASWNLSNARAFINCSEPCKPATFDRFAAAFAGAGVRPDQLQCCYAMAETVFAVSQTRLGFAPSRVTVDGAYLGQGDTLRLAAPGPGGVALIETGPPLDGVAISIRDTTGSDLVEDQIGQIYLSGAFLFSGYNFDPELTDRKLRDGLYASGDLGFRHAGTLFVLGRIDDVIIVNGRNLYAHEVEAQVSLVAGVKAGRAVALAWFDERVGSHALVILAERAAGASRPDEDIRRDMMTGIHSVFNVIPKAVQLMPEGRLVKTSSGKISRSENLARYEGRSELGQDDSARRR